MPSKKIVVVGIAAGLALFCARPGMAEGKFDTTDKSAGSKGKAADVASASDIAEDGVFTVNASAHTDDPVAGPSAAFSDVVAAKTFTLEPGTYQGRVAVTDLYGQATSGHFGGSSASINTVVDCATCTDVQNSSMNIIRSLPLQDEALNQRLVALVAFTVTEATTVTISTTIDALAETSTGVITPHNQLWVSDGGDVALKGIIGGIEVAPYEPAH